MSLLVLALGAASPLGVGAASNQVEIAAGTKRIVMTDVTDAEGEPVRASRWSKLDPGASRLERMVSLARQALEDPLAQAQAWGLTDIPLLVALPEGGGPSFDLDALMGEMAAPATDVDLECREEWLFHTGRAGFAEALALAEHLLFERRVPAVLVGGVDSVVTDDSLKRLVLQQRAYCAGYDGTITGEGAAFALVVSRTGSLATTLPLDVVDRVPRILGVAAAREPIPFFRREPSNADGLTAAFAKLREHDAIGARRVNSIVGCQTGERYFMREIAAAMIRNAPFLPTEPSHALMTQFVGDAGAASGALALVWADWSLGKDELPGAVPGTPPRVLVYGSSDDGHVSAYVVEAGPAHQSAYGHKVAAQAQSPQPVDATRLLRALSPGYGGELFEEHLAEAGFIVYDRLFDLRERGLSWLDVEGTEERMARHFDALRLDSGRSMAFARNQLDSPNEDIRLGSVAFLTDPLAPADYLKVVIREWEKQPPPKRDLWLRALQLSEHPTLPSTVERLAYCDDEALAIQAVWLLGHSRAGHASQFAGLVQNRSLPLSVRETAARSLAVVAPGEGENALMDFAREYPESPAAVWALMTCGHEGGSKLAFRAAATAGLPPEGMLWLLALRGGCREAQVIRSRLQDRDRLHEAVWSLGTLGCPEDVPSLIDLVGHEWTALQDAAAQALELVLGRAPEAPPKDKGEFAQAVADAEAKHRRAMEGPCKEPDAWRALWAEMRGAFVRGERYRRGRPFSLTDCFAEVEGAYPLSARQRALDELRMRTGKPWDLEADWLARRQKAALAGLKQAMGPQR